MLERFVRRLLTLLAGIGYTFLGTGLGGFFFALGVNTGIAIGLIVVGILFIVLALVFDTLVDAVDGRGS